MTVIVVVFGPSLILADLGKILGPIYHPPPPTPFFCVCAHEEGRVGKFPPPKISTKIC